MFQMRVFSPASAEWFGGGLETNETLWKEKKKKRKKTLCTPLSRIYTDSPLVLVPWSGLYHFKAVRVGARFGG